MSISASSIIKEKRINTDSLFVYKIEERRSLNFYCNHDFIIINDPEALKQNEYLLTSESGLDSIDKKQFEIIYEGQSFHVSQLTLKFLNPRKRDQTTNPYYILKHLLV